LRPAAGSGARRTPAAKPYHRTIVEAIAAVDVQLVNLRWRWWHGEWAEDADRVARAMAAIDALLERRHELVQASGDAAAA